MRVYVESTLRDVSGVEAHLHGTRGGSALPGSPIDAEFDVDIQTDGGDRGELNDAFLFYLPSDWRSGTVTLKVDVNPDHTALESNYTNNDFTEVVTFNDTHTLCIDMVRVHLHPTTSSIDDEGFWDIVAMLKRIYPIADVTIYEGGTIYPVWHDFGSNYDLPDDFDWVISRVWWYNTWHDDPDECNETYYWGMAHPDHLAGRWGMAYMDGNEGSGVMDVSTDFSDNYPYWMYPKGGFTLAHELGHNFDRAHVSCTGSEADAGYYPYDTCQIAPDEEDGYYGIIRPLGYSSSNPEIIEPTEATPLMSYGWPMWVDDYTYRALFNKVDVTASTADVAATLPAAWRLPSEYLYVAGVITPTAEMASFDTFYVRSEAKPSLLAESWAHAQVDDATYSLTLEDSVGTILFTHTFTPSGGYVGMGITTTLLHFGEVIPFNPATARITLRHQGVQIADRSVSANKPRVSINEPSGGSYSQAITITWESIDDDLDDLYTPYSIAQITAPPGSRWLPIS